MSIVLGSFLACGRRGERAKKIDRNKGTYRTIGVHSDDIDHTSECHRIYDVVHDLWIAKRLFGTCGWLFRLTSRIELVHGLQSFCGDG